MVADDQGNLYCEMAFQKLLITTSTARYRTMERRVNHFELSGFPAVPVHHVLETPPPPTDDVKDMNNDRI